MTDLITAEEAKKLLDGTTPGPWDWDTGDGTIYMADGDVSPRIATIDWDNTDADQGYADAELIAAAPDLARTVIALHAQPADAKAAQAMVRDRAEKAEAERVSEWNKRRDADSSRNVARAACDTMRAERDRLAAANAVLEAKVAGLRDFVDDFAKAKIDALRYSPPYGSSPEDEPDPVVDAKTVWAWQADAKAALATQEAGNA